MTVWRQKSCDTRFRGYASTLRYPHCEFNNFLPQIQFFQKPLATHVEQIIFVHCQAISYADNKNLQFFRSSKKLRKITKKLMTEVHRVQQTMSQKPIQKDREGERTFRFIDGLSLIIRRLSFSSKCYFLFSWHRTLKSSEVFE